MNLDFVEKFDELEDRFYADPDGTKESIIKELLTIHMAIEDEDTLNRFSILVSSRCGGIYIPYVFWDKLAGFLTSPDERAYLQEIINAFTQGDFEEEEQRKMKPLLITYVANEKEFEINKLFTLIIEKAHPTVKEYFSKLITFVQKNVRSTQMYKDKFDMLKNVAPDFSLMSLPISQLREKFQRA